MALWKAIQKGIIDVVASDHAPKAKKIEDPFFEAPYGSPQSETMLTVTYDEGVNKGRIKPSKLVQLLSENPAKIFGLYPKKGTIQKGSDADLVIFDPNHIIPSSTRINILEHPIRFMKGEDVLENLSLPCRGEGSWLRMER